MTNLLRDTDDVLRKLKEIVQLFNSMPEIGMTVRDILYKLNYTDKDLVRLSNNRGLRGGICEKIMFGKWNDNRKQSDFLDYGFEGDQKVGVIKKLKSNKISTPDTLKITHFNNNDLFKYDEELLWDMSSLRKKCSVLFMPIFSFEGKGKLLDSRLLGGYHYILGDDDLERIKREFIDIIYDAKKQIELYGRMKSTTARRKHLQIRTSGQGKNKRAKDSQKAYSWYLTISCLRDVIYTKLPENITSLLDN